MPIHSFNTGQLGELRNAFEKYGSRADLMWCGALVMLKSKFGERTRFVFKQSLTRMGHSREWGNSQRIPMSVSAGNRIAESWKGRHLFAACLRWFIKVWMTVQRHKQDRHSDKTKEVTETTGIWGRLPTFADLRWSNSLLMAYFFWGMGVRAICSVSNRR